MGLFNTPYSINSKLLVFRSLSYEDFDSEVQFMDDESLFHVSHDYFDSPCFFKIVGWIPNDPNVPLFEVQKFPRNYNDLEESEHQVRADEIENWLNTWDNHVKKIMEAEVLYLDPELDNLREELMLKLGITEESAEKILNETQKAHAYQFCDQISDILDDLESNKYDETKIREIKFDLEKIKRDIENLKIKTNKDLMMGVASAWGKVKLAKVGKYILDKASDGVAAKFIGDLIDKTF